MVKRNSSKSTTVPAFLEPSRAGFLALATATTVIAVPAGGVGRLAGAGAEVTVDLEPLSCWRGRGAASMTAASIFAGWPQHAAAHSTPWTRRAYTTVRTQVVLPVLVGGCTTLTYFLTLALFWSAVITHIDHCIIMSNAALLTGPPRARYVSFHAAVTDDEGLPGYGAPNVTVLHNLMTTDAVVTVRWVSLIRALELEVVRVSTTPTSTDPNKVCGDVTACKSYAFQASIQGIVCHSMGYLKETLNVRL